ncbi:DUF2478 domain-containing protein [Bradyrhizobium ivorense]|uniref:DUF2478 domain-containing protein n=1 Tax=Bradyrhizobium ivorense TaxID=2511166 RepID=UPI0011177868|nr:DUF2478 domain-containing protein [Bradyrhizobium ivorense]
MSADRPPDTAAAALESLEECARKVDAGSAATNSDRALDADIPVVIAVSRQSFADWITFAGGMSVKLACDRSVLDAWWRGVALRAARPIAPNHTTVCEC